MPAEEMLRYVLTKSSMGRTETPPRCRAGRGIPFHFNAMHQRGNLLCKNVNNNQPAASH
jgi:hypothetical protein